jgi:hypothetical protein
MHACPLLLQDRSWCADHSDIFDALRANDSSCTSIDWSNESLGDGVAKVIIAPFATVVVIVCPCSGGGGGWLVLMVVVVVAVLEVLYVVVVVIWGRVVVGGWS